MEVKYAVYPGVVLSKSDGDLHYIPARMLMHLYGVAPGECLEIDELRSPRNRVEQLDVESRIRRAKEEKLIALRPQFSGDYSLPVA